MTPAQKDTEGDKDELSSIPRLELTGTDDNELLLATLLERDTDGDTTAEDDTSPDDTEGDTDVLSSIGRLEVTATDEKRTTARKAA